MTDIGQNIDDPVLAAAYDDLVCFCMLIWPRYEHAPHLDVIANDLMALERYVATNGAEGFKQVLEEMPPRHGKSRLISWIFPAWFLGRNPDKRVMIGCYGESLAVKASRYVRAIIRKPVYQLIFPGVALSNDSQAKNAWDLAAPYEGGLEALGKGGPATGKGADLLITDDLVKSRAEAQSEIIREKDWDWLNDDIRTRIEPGGVHCSVMTRWHYDDVHGRLRKNEPDDWVIHSFPAIAGTADPLGRMPGEALWAKRYDIAALLKLKRNMGEVEPTNLTV